MRHPCTIWLVAAFVAVPTAGLTQDTTPDWANKSGAVGVGGNTTLGGTSGINIRTYLTPQLGLHLTFGFGLDNQTVEGVDPADPDQEDSTSVFAGSLQASYKLAYWDRGHLAAFVGPDFRATSTTSEVGPDDGSDASFTEVLIGLGLMGEYFPARYLSLFLQAGLVIDFISGEDTETSGGIDTTNSVSGFALGLGSQLEGSAGFTVWFK